MDGLRTFLSQVGLTEYHDIFVAKGFDKEGDICYLNDEDLNAMYIIDAKDRQTILNAARHYEPSKQYRMHEWLQGAGLEHYFESFLQSDLLDLAAVARLQLPDEQLYDELEITLPGHKRRLERAVKQLVQVHTTELPVIVSEVSDDVMPKTREVISNSCKSSAPPEVAVAFGRWAKPFCLRDAKYDFLLLNATVVSTLDSRDRVDIEFMVDSGSDVVTLRQTVLDLLDLELIGPINSKGVHASRVKNLYKANILIGNTSLEIEVMGESYDSIGSRVIRHFRHYISGSQHVWLKGDYLDPTLKSEEIKPGSIFENISSESSSQEWDEPKSALTKENTEKDVRIETDKNEDSEQAKHIDDLVKSDSVPRHIRALPNTISEIKGIEKPGCFDFKGSVYDTGVKHTDQSHEEIDETDKFISDSSDVIDIGPIIAENRKRHAQNSTFSNQNALSPERALGRVVKRSRRSPATEKRSKMDAAISEKSKIRTVLNQRSVFYHSQDSQN